MPFRVKVVRRAARQIEEAAAWWTANRPAAPVAFREEIRAGFELIASHPRIGARALNRKLEGVRRIHVSRIRNHIYYRVRADAETVEVLAFWHTSRGSGPHL
jgi:plasmid stabilization system protein ParE